MDFFFFTSDFKINQIKWIHYPSRMGFPSGSDGKESPCKARDPGSIPGSGRSSGEGMATHFSIFAWRIPQTEEPGGLQPMRSQTDGCD